MKTYKTAIIGATGYTGVELVRLLSAHPAFQICALSSDRGAGQALASSYPALRGFDLPSLCSSQEVIEGPAGSFDLAFLAVPHTQAMSLVKALDQKVACIVDLSADFRLQDSAVYAQWYGVAHSAPELLSGAVYGLPELNRAQLKGAHLIANPGCYPTASALALLPALQGGVVDGQVPVVINAISGISGAGKAPSAKNLYGSADQNLYAYAPLVHRHTPEIAQTYAQAAGQELPDLVFTAHLAPLMRGMVATVTCKTHAGTELDQLMELYFRYYDSTPLTTFLGQVMPQSKDLRGTAAAQVGIAFDQKRQLLVASCALDNLGKGASGQAVQNANLAMGLPETMGLGQLVAAI
ncbi:MAG: N-acetyl-gamma-glutamyl-phosphate reductase [Coriobacteriales bacterium]|jgi:N-acetyl-gamma-glutamyl-phosphate reductase|nr:N-acetyl-gamma-glutamyl-phosphate reductase [Coriobacteriales bacterium]